MTWADARYNESSPRTTPMAPIEPSEKLTSDAGSRTIGRIVIEMLLLVLAGALVWGLAWELGHEHLGLIAAIILWIVGGPALEIARVISARAPSSDAPKEQK